MNQLAQMKTKMKFFDIYSLTIKAEFFSYTLNWLGGGINSKALMDDIKSGKINKGNLEKWKEIDSRRTDDIADQTVGEVLKIETNNEEIAKKLLRMKVKDKKTLEKIRNLKSYTFNSEVSAEEYYTNGGKWYAKCDLSLLDKLRNQYLGFLDNCERRISTEKKEYLSYAKSVGSNREYYLFEKIVSASLHSKQNAISVFTNFITAFFIGMVGLADSTETEAEKNEAWLQSCIDKVKGE
jgi:hypothetical protein